MDNVAQTLRPRLIQIKNAAVYARNPTNSGVLYLIQFNLWNVNSVFDMKRALKN